MPELVPARKSNCGGSHRPAGKILRLVVGNVVIGGVVAGIDVVVIVVVAGAVVVEVVPVGVLRTGGAFGVVAVGDARPGDRRGSCCYRLVFRRPRDRTRCTSTRRILCWHRASMFAVGRNWNMRDTDPAPLPQRETHRANNIEGKTIDPARQL
jgi:hypothetical protein